MKKRPITLLEIMIVIFLIGLIGGVVGYNVKGSLDEGKKFKTIQAQSQIRDVLLLQASINNHSLKEIVEHKKKYLRESGMIKDVDQMLKDGWNKPFQVSVVVVDGVEDIEVKSEGLINYLASHKKEKESDKKETEKSDSP